MPFHIVVALDGSALAEAVLPPTQVLARALGGSLTLLHVVEVPADAQLARHPTMQGMVEAEQQRALRYLEGVEARVKGEGLSVAHVVERGDPGTEIVKYAAANGADLLAIASHGRSGPQRWFYGSVAEKVLGLARVPVLLVRSTAELAAPLTAVRRLVVPLDGSELSATALPVAQRLAKALGVPVTLVQAYGVPTSIYAANEPMYGSGFDIGQLLTDLKAAAQEDLDQASARVQQAGLAVDTVLFEGPAARVIVDEARREAGSVVVMSTHGRSGFAGALLGSVARQVLRSDIVTITIPPGAAD